MNQVNILHCQSHQEHLEAGRPLGDLLEESPGCWDHSTPKIMVSSMRKRIKQNMILGTNFRQFLQFVSFLSQWLQLMERDQNRDSWVCHKAELMALFSDHSLPKIHMFSYAQIRLQSPEIAEYLFQLSVLSQWLQLVECQLDSLLQEVCICLTPSYR